MVDTAQPDLKRILTSTTVGETAMAGWPTLDVGQTAADAAARMRATKRGSSLVCDAGKIAGIFTERDLLRLLAAGGSLDTPLAEAMTGNPQTVSTAQTLFEAARLMNEGGYRRLPVVDEAGSPVGLIDVKTITHFIVEQIPETVYNQAASRELTAKTPEGA